MATSDHTSLVTIRFSKPGTQPPIYLAGSFSDPAWEPQEMKHEAKADGELEFTKEVSVQEGKQYQYKFRVGDGEWWVLNEQAPIATDNIGNRNNLLSVPADYVTQEEFQEGKRNTDILPSPKSDSSSPADMDLKSPVTTDAKVVGHVADDTIISPQTSDEISQEKSTAQSSTDTSPGVDTPSSKESSQEQIPKKHTSRIDTLKSDDIDPLDRAETPDIANVAAEVAESAALLDQRQPTPPISDEEAGRIGYRRMSTTPIPDVASTAAEVADVAAKLDEHVVSGIEYEPPSLNIDDDDDFDYTTTPEEDRVPLFPHEAPGPTDKVADSLESRRVSAVSTPVDPPRRENFNDPTLLPFPTDREGVFAQIHTLERQLPPDSTLPGSSPSSPALGTLPNSWSVESLNMPSPRLLGNSSPSLHAISEDKEVEHVSLNSRRHRNSALRSVSSQQDISQDSSYSIDDKSPMSEVITEQNGASQEPNSPLSPAGTDIKKIVTKDESSDSIIHYDFSAPAQDTSSEPETSNKEDESNDLKDDSLIDTVRKTIPDQISPFSSTKKDADQATNPDMAVSSDGPSASGHISMNGDGPSEEAVPKLGKESPRPSLIERRQGSSQDFALSKQPTVDGDKDTMTNRPTIEIDRVSPVLNPKNTAQTKTGNSLLTTSAPAVLTPFIVGGERQLGLPSERETPPISIEAPTITLQPATPRSSIRTAGTDPTETPPKAESTGTSTGTENSDLVSRKKQRTMSPTPDRPLTPSSMRSNKDVKSKNFLKAFWRVVFVDWIGGLIARLCGGGRDALLVASALAVVVVIPAALYFY